VNIFFLLRENLLTFNKVKYTYIKKILVETFPIGLSLFSVSIYYNLDMVMIKMLKTDYDTGIYNAAVKLFLLGIIPLNIILIVFFPRLSKYKLIISDEFWSNIRAYGIILITYSFFVSLLMFFLSPQLIILIFSEKYIDSIQPLKILSLNIMFVGLNIFLGNPLIAWNRQKVYALAVSFGAIVNIVMNLVLIPSYSYNGAATATIFSEILVFIFFMVIHFRLYKKGKYAKI
jgi:O-antigen/teichoic acid export membrane protein